MKKKKISVFVIYLRNFVFGVEDSLVSTVGLLSGIAAGGANKSTIALTGIVLVFVEALSMAVGSFLSENSAEEYQSRRRVSERQPFLGALVMFASYFLSGFIPLGPYLFLTIDLAFPTSIIASIAALGILGLISAYFSHLSAKRSIWEMVILGGAAIAIGVIVGNLAKSFVN